MYGALLVIWTIVPAFVSVMGGCLATDIVKGICVPWGSYTSYAAEKTITSLLFSFTYFVPMMLTVFCYARIVHSLLTRKVIRRQFFYSSRATFLT